MKIILSRKGFDSQNGKTPSPIMPNGDLISMPIPSGDKDRYQDLVYQGHDYLDILSDLKPSMKYGHCHVDPDLSPKTRKNRPGHWTPAFGQINQSQIYLSETVRVEPGDLFLFFGSFHRVKEENGHYRYVRHSGDFYQDNDIHAIFGYLQVGKIVTDPEEAKKLFLAPSRVRRSDQQSDERDLSSGGAPFVPPRPPGMWTVQIRRETGFDA
jgi:hypothetical protein